MNIDSHIIGDRRTAVNPETATTTRACRSATLARPALQARSRRSLTRLLDAAEAVLGAGGVDAATVPAIARRAGMSVGIVYRRFPDKDALLRATCLRFFERTRASNRDALDPACWEGVPLEQLIRTLVRGMVQAYQDRRGLLTAILRFGQTHPDREFRRLADRLSLEAFEAIGALLLRHRERIRHPRPEQAVRLALQVVAHTLRGVLLPDPASPMPADLADELTSMVLGYLRVAR